MKFYSDFIFITFLTHAALSKISKNFAILIPIQLTTLSQYTLSPYIFNTIFLYLMSQLG